MSPLEEKIALLAPHLYRGELSAYLRWDTQPRMSYSTASISAHDHGQPSKRGDIVVVYELYGRYKGESVIVLTPFSDDGQRNLIGHVLADDADLLTLM